MSYISGARSVADKQVRISSTKIDGIGPKKAIQVRYRLGSIGDFPEGLQGRYALLLRKTILFFGQGAQKGEWAGLKACRHIANEFTVRPH